MKKFIIFALGLGILAILAADTVFVALGTASAFTIAETAVGWAFVLAVAVAAFVKTVNGSWPFQRVIPNVDYLTSRIDELDAENDDLREERDTLNEKIGELNDRLTAYEDGDDMPDTEPEPDLEAEFADEHLEGLEPVIATVLPDGKLQDLYTLPPEPSIDEAYAAARASLDAREAEGNPVENPRIRFRPVYL